MYDDVFVVVGGDDDDDVSRPDIHRGCPRQDDISVQCNERIQLVESV